jgi:hypothetical protein
MDYTTEQLYEQVKRSLRQALVQLEIDISQPFILACSECGLPFRLDIEVGMIAEHGRLEHNLDVDDGDLSLDLIFVGEGPPPEGKNG